MTPEEIGDINYRLRKGQSVDGIAEDLGIKRGLVKLVQNGAIAKEAYGVPATPLEGQERHRGSHAASKLSKYRQPRASFRP